MDGETQIITPKFHTKFILSFIFQKRMRDDAILIEIYGQTENVGSILIPNPNGPLGNCGQLIDSVKVKVFWNYNTITFWTVSTCKHNYFLYKHYWGLTAIKESIKIFLKYSSL